jgi:hypothetical protein
VRRERRPHRLEGDRHGDARHAVGPLAAAPGRGRDLRRLPALGPPAPQRRARPGSDAARHQPGARPAHGPAPPRADAAPGGPGVRPGGGRGGVRAVVGGRAGVAGDLRRAGDLGPGAGGGAARVRRRLRLRLARRQHRAGHRELRGGRPEPLLAGPGQHDRRQPAADRDRLGAGGAAGLVPLPHPGTAWSTPDRSSGSAPSSWSSGSRHWPPRRRSCWSPGCTPGT